MSMLRLSNIDMVSWLVEQAVIEGRTGFDIRELAKLDTIEDVLDYAQLRLGKYYLGKGSSRAVFRLSSKRVLKVARNKLGIAQNDVEAEVGTEPLFSEIVATNYDHDDGYLWLVSELVRPLKNKEEFYALSGSPPYSPTEAVPFDIFYDLTRNYAATKKIDSDADLRNAAQKWKHLGITPDQYVKIAKSLFMRRVYSLMADGGLLPGDIVMLDHWGKAADGRLVILDYGWSAMSMAVRDKPDSSFGSAPSSFYDRVGDLSSS